MSSGVCFQLLQVISTFAKDKLVVFIGDWQLTSHLNIQKYRINKHLMYLVMMIYFMDSKVTLTTTFLLKEGRTHFLMQCQIYKFASTVS